LLVEEDEGLVLLFPESLEEELPLFRFFFFLRFFFEVESVD